MSIIAIIVLIIVIILIFVLIHKQLHGGVYTTYIPQEPTYQYTARELINDATDLYLTIESGQQYNLYVTDSTMTMDKFKYKWINDDVPQPLSKLAINLANEYNSIESLLTNMRLKEGVKFYFEPFVFAFVEAVVACYIDKGIELTDFNTANSPMGSFNIVIFCKDGAEDRVLRLYKQKYLMREREKWKELIDDSVAINNVFSKSNLISLPIYSSAYIKHDNLSIDGYNGEDMYGAQWMLLPKLNEFKNTWQQSCITDPLHTYDWIVKYIKTLRDVAIKLHKNDMAFGDWKWYNAMVDPKTNKVLISDIEFYLFKHLTEHTVIDFTFSITHRCRYLYIKKISSPAYAEKNNGILNLDKYKELIKRFDNFIVMREALTTVCSIIYYCKNNEMIYLDLISTVDVEQFCNQMNSYITELINNGVTDTEKKVLDVCTAITNEMLINHKYKNIDIEPMSDENTAMCINALIEAIQGVDMNIDAFKQELIEIYGRNINDVYDDSEAMHSSTDVSINNGSHTTAQSNHTSVRPTDIHSSNDLSTPQPFESSTYVSSSQPFYYYDSDLDIP